MYTMTVKALEGALRNMEMYHAKDCACNECKNIREALAAERATDMRKPFKFSADKRDPDDREGIDFPGLIETAKRDWEVER